MPIKFNKLVHNLRDSYWIVKLIISGGSKGIAY